MSKIRHSGVGFLRVIEIVLRITFEDSKMKITVQEKQTRLIKKKHKKSEGKFYIKKTFYIFLIVCIKNLDTTMYYFVGLLNSI